jgi:hypothetical protein
MQVIVNITTSSRNELLVTTIKKPEPIRRGVEIGHCFKCTLPLPTKPVEVPSMVVST